MYGSKHASQSLSDKQFVCTYTFNLKTTGYKWTSCVSNDCTTIGDIPCVVWSCMRDLTRELWPQTCTSHSLIQQCVFILQACKYIVIQSCQGHMFHGSEICWALSFGNTDMQDILPPLSTLINCTTIVNRSQLK